MHVRKVKGLQKLIYNMKQRHFATQTVPIKVVSDSDYDDLGLAKFSL